MRFFYATLFALILALPFVARWMLVAPERAPASSERSARLVILTPHNGDIRREYARAFDAWHRNHYGQPVTLDYHVPGGTNDMVRLLSATYAEYRDASGKLPQNFSTDLGLHLVWGGGDYTFYHDLQPLGILQPMLLPNGLLRQAFPQDALAGVRLYDSTKDSHGDPTPQWVGVALSSFGIVYNSQLYQALSLPYPKTWFDLTDPRLFQLVALADPGHSGSAAVSYMMVLQRAMADGEQELFEIHPELRKLPPAELNKRADYRAAIADGWRRGMGQLLLVAANARYFADSSEVPPTDVSRGEAAAGMSIDFYARVTEGIVGSERAHFISPRAATAITPDSVAILRGVSGEQLALATHFVEFLLSPEGQRLWILKPGEPGGPVERSPRRMPIRRDVYADQSGWADHFNPFEEAGNFNQRGAWMALMADTRPIWQAAWIDSRDMLVSTYRRILAEPDETLRRRLLGQLAQVPVTMQDVEHRRTERLRIEQSHGDLDAWAARDRLEWGNRFRRHYADIAAQAH